MRILGIDPGLTRCGLGIVTLSPSRRLEFNHVEVLTTPATMELPKRLAILGQSIERILKSQKVDEVAIERVFAQQNLPSVMGVAQITGIVMFLAETNGVPIKMYTPNEVKNRVTGYGAADKKQVTNMVTKILGLKSAPKPADAADALALAITHAWDSQKSGTSVSIIGRSEPTPAQKAWAQAEKRVKKMR